MNDMTIGLHQNDEDLLAYEICDEVLETAACTGHAKAGSYTLAACTGLSACPS